MSEQNSSGGVFGGSRVGFFEHEISNWIRGRLRASTGEPAAAPLSVPDHPRLLTMREVEGRVGFSRVHLWRMEKAGRFPKRVRLADPQTADADA
jgi:predicted DNA-binding transcriptional regulator AlpA